MMNNSIIPTAKDFFNKQTPNMCNTLAHLKFYCMDNNLQTTVPADVAAVGTSVDDSPGSLGMVC